ncbi:MAG: tol-pal system protein YbgF [Rhizobiales bacterium]|nr:tol-pal system protein YbgF [Hyphomicrobiales bacterium]
MAGAASAQSNSGGFLDNLFSRGENQQQGQPQGQSQVEYRRNIQGGQGAADDPTEAGLRLDRLENALRQLTGAIEQMQYRNQQLEMQLKRLQDDTDYRLQQLGSKGGAAPAPVYAPPAAQPGRRGDVFDPNQRPNAPGAPRVLGNETVLAAPAQNQANEQPIGAPGGRAAGAPLDLNALSGNQLPPPPVVRENAAPVQAAQTVSQPAQQLPPVMAPRNAAAPAQQMATLPPSTSPQDEYDLAYGYVLRKDYALAEQTFRDFLSKYPNERLVPDAHYWLGESLFQRQRYRDAAESFLAVSTKYDKSGKAPDSLLRLGQSLAALNQKEAACATLAEVGRKFPRASASVKRGVEQEQKRVRC